mmetsp:Transcript_13815/g.32485  ORF Transcript_13815/g.32485 Transcript_13815/m.32485 type:complete len:376 (-) Transcript_13815:844-1971(-)
MARGCSRESVEGFLDQTHVLGAHVRAVHFEVGVEGGLVGGEELGEEVEEGEGGRVRCHHLLQDPVEHLHHLPGFVEDGRDGLDEDLEVLAALERGQPREIVADRRTDALLHVLVPAFLDRAEDALATVDFAEQKHHLSAFRDGGHDVVEVVFGEEHRLWAEVPALEACHQLGHQHGVVALAVDDLPCRGEGVGVASHVDDFVEFGERVRDRRKELCDAAVVGVLVADSGEVHVPPAPRRLDLGDDAWDQPQRPHHVQDLDDGEVECEEVELVGAVRRQLLLRRCRGGGSRRGERRRLVRARKGGGVGASADESAQVRLPHACLLQAWVGVGAGGKAVAELRGVAHTLQQRCHLGVGVVASDPHVLLLQTKLDGEV